MNNNRLHTRIALNFVGSLFLACNSVIAQDPVMPSKKVYKIHESEIFIGEFTYGEELLIREYHEGARLVIGKFCSISDSVTIFLGGNHRVDWATTYPFGHVYSEIFSNYKALETSCTKGDIIIGNDVWIGSGATIFSGITIGDGAVIAGCSVVTKNVPPYAIVGGNPARLIRYRFEQEIIDLLLELRWWDLDIQKIKDISKELCSEPTVEKLRLLIQKYR
ncbi:CatB-related O-acetyltransferase [Candidatus Babeliales bacterium]|nr:CatB-related O-acetyltransferase [Candidatus Babeliales bacterium]